MEKKGGEVKFSTRTLYGLKAVLVLASRFGEGSVSVSQIAKKENISTSYLEQILNSLKRKGLVNSVRGPQGGYVLAQKPQDISLDKLLEILTQKGIFKVKNQTIKSKTMDEISIADQLFWNNLRLLLLNGLSKVTLKDLIDEARSLKKNNSNSDHTFSI